MIQADFAAHPQAAPDASIQWQGDHGRADSKASAGRASCASGRRLPRRAPTSRPGIAVRADAALVLDRRGEAPPAPAARTAGLWVARASRAQVILRRWSRGGVSHGRVTRASDASGAEEARGLRAVDSLGRSRRGDRHHFTRHRLRTAGGRLSQPGGWCRQRHRLKLF